MTTKNEMVSFLRSLAAYHQESNQAGLPALLLQQGTWFEGRVDSDAYAVAKRWKKKNKPAAQDCYCNSQEFCAANNGSHYFEGFVLVQKGLLPSEHCWVVMQDDRVVDFTLEALEARVVENGHPVDLRGALYVGVEVPRARIKERLDETGWYEPIAELFYADQIKQIAVGGQGTPAPGRTRKRPTK